MKRLLMYLLLIVAAVVLYFVGFGEGIVPLMVLYLIVEIALGSRLGSAFKRKQQQDF